MLYRILKIIVKPIRPLFLRLVYINRKAFKIKGPYIICSNHIHVLDPIVIALASPRKVRFMAKSQLFKNKFLGWLIRKLGSFKVDRGANDVSAIKNALKVLRSGDVLGIFPEGMREKAGTLQAFHNGAALLALRTGVPVVPVALIGKYKLWGKIIISAEDPINFSSFEGKTDPEALREASDKIYAGVARALEKGMKI